MWLYGYDSVMFSFPYPSPPGKIHPVEDVKDNLFSLLIWIAIAVAAFLAFRKFACWYMKIDERVDLLEEQTELLREISRKLDRPGP